MADEKKEHTMDDAIAEVARKTGQDLPEAEEASEPETVESARELSMDDILNCDDSYLEPLTIPEWGGTIYLRIMKGSERDGFEKSMLDANNKPTLLANVRARFACRIVCDSKGKRLFADGQAGALGEKSSKALDTIWEVGRRLNSMGEDDIDDAEKN